MSILRLGLAMWSLLQSACTAEVVAAGDPAVHTRSLLGRMVRDQELPGAQYVALDADRVRLEAHVGVADVATGQPMQGGTLQMAYSLTKVVTAIAVMQLADADKLDLDDPRVESLGRGYGGLWSSASALAAVLQDLLRVRPKLLSASARDQMLTEQRTSDGKPTASTLGWVIGELNGVRDFGKQGGGLGFHGNARIYPELGLATLLLCNRTELTPGPIDARSDVLDAALVAHGRAAAR